MPTRTIRLGRAAAWPEVLAAVAAVALASALAGCSPTPAAAGMVRVTTQGVATLTAPPSAATKAATQSASSPTPVPASATVEPSPTLTPQPSPTAEPSKAPTVEPSPTFTAEPAPTPDALAATREVRLPVLMYHYIEPWPADAGELRQGLTVRPEDFAAQMAYLHDYGYVTVSLYDLVEALAVGRPLPEKAVVLTFDDGYRSLLDYAAPTMAAYGYTGTIFVITQLMDEGFPQYLTWPQAEHLYALGWQIEPHTKTHDQLQGRDRDFQLYQMLGSLQTVEAHIGRTPRFLSYPSGRYDALTTELATEMHLWGAVTTEFGRLHTYASLYTLTRVRVSGTETLQGFVNGLEGDLAP